MNKLQVTDRAWTFSSLSWTQTLNSTQILFQRPKQLHWMSFEVTPTSFHKDSHSNKQNMMTSELSITLA